MRAAPKRRKAVRRGEILAAARSVFAEKPFDQASMGEIAARADCVEGTIYAYFKSKRDLFDAVLAAFYERLIAEIEPRFAAIEATADRLRYLVARHLELAVEEPAGTLLRIRETRGHERYFGSQLHALNRRYTQFLVRTIEDGIARGELGAGLDPQLARDFVYGGLEHWIQRTLGRGKRIDPPRAARAITAMLLGGWRGEPPTRRAAGSSATLGRIDARLARIEQAVLGRKERVS